MKLYNYNSMLLRKIIQIFLLLALLSVSLTAQTRSNASAQIVFDSYSLEINRTIPIGILIELENDWHIYWRNPGDSGMPTSIDFNLPDGFTISEIKWPAPKAFEYDGLASYGYEKQVLLLADLSVPGNYNLNSIKITANLKSLICKDVCIPFNTTVSTQIDLSNNFKVDEQILKLFIDARNNLPDVKHNIDFSVKVDDELITLIIQNPEVNTTEIKSLYFLPHDNGIFKNSIDQRFIQNENKTELAIEFDHFRIEEPKEIYGLLIYVIGNPGKSKKVYEIKQLIN
jgi:DsbC/DsbD-like thiol-disulfide interchange protein